MRSVVSKLSFAIDCTRCPGDGVIRPRNKGVDWPEPCPCEARSAFSQYQLARVLEEDPKTIARVEGLRARSEVAFRVLCKLTSSRLLTTSARTPGLKRIV